MKMNNNQKVNLLTNDRAFLLNTVKPKVDLNIKNNYHDMADIFAKPKKKTFEYILEGGVIKVYLVENGVRKQCVKKIPLKEATPDILAKIQNITFMDMIQIVDMQKEEESKDDPENDVKGAYGKEIEEYKKHIGFPDF